MVAGSTANDAHWSRTDSANLAGDGLRGLLFSSKLDDMVNGYLLGLLLGLLASDTGGYNSFHLVLLQEVTRFIVRARIP